jgi:hypothetical protein
MPLLKFAATLESTSHSDYYFCIHRKTHARVVITTRVKNIIDQGQWTHCLPEDLEEIRNLRELGILIETEI